MFSEEYYKSNNYTDYLARGDRYQKLANETLDLLDQLSLPHKIVCDFGCAVGHLLPALDKRSTYSYGTDISEYALDVCKEKKLNVRLEPKWDMNHDLVYSLDVFEHMQVEELNEFFDKIKSNVIIFRMPVCAREGGDYVLEVSRRDPTHTIRWTKEQWSDYFKRYGYHCLELNLHTIYNSEGVYSGLAIQV
jgi:2-polyprenyl-3-methyl-5-hydroxy-6-metoxy-1,4-benzoquinol methylase